MKDGTPGEEVYVYLKLRTFAFLAIIALVGNGWLRSQTVGAPAGNSNVAHLYLVEKDPLNNWQIVPGGAWGKLVYTRTGPTFAFVFNGHKLDPGVSYTLMYYPDPWPGIGLKCLGTGVAEATGDVHIMGTPDTGSLPLANDWNANATTTTDPPHTGAKIWLVLKSDVPCTNGSVWSPLNWHPTQYLFDTQFITYTKTP